VEGHEQSTHDQEELEEVLDGEIVESSPTPTPIIAEVHAVERAPSGWNAAPVQTAVAAATGFIAGAATLALLRRYGLTRGTARELELARDEQLRRQPEQVPVRSGTYLVSIRTLQPPR
jgi:hypothetical protein